MKLMIIQDEQIFFLIILMLIFRRSDHISKFQGCVNFIILSIFKLCIANTTFL